MNERNNFSLHNDSVMIREITYSPIAPAPRSPERIVKMVYDDRDRRRDDRERDRDRDRDRDRGRDRDRYRDRGRRSRSRSRSNRRYRSSRQHSRSRSRSYGRSHSHSPMSSRRRHTGTRDHPKPSRCLGVFGLSVHTTENELYNIMSKYGKVERVQVVIDAKTGRSRGFSFVYFASADDAKEAKDHCTGMRIDGKNIRVDFSITQRAHTPTPGIYMGKPTHMSDRSDRSDRRRDRDSGDGYRRRRSPSPSRRRRDRSRSRSYSQRRY